MLYRFPALFLSLFIGLSTIGILPVPALGETRGICGHDKSADHQELSRRLQALDQQIALRLAQITHNQGSQPETGHLAARGFLDRLDALMVEIRRLERHQAVPLVHKVDQLRGVVSNLERVADGGDLETALPRIYGTSSVTVRQPADLGGVPDNDDCADALVVEVGDTVIGDTTDATRDGQASCGSSLFSNDVWFKLTVPETGYYSVDTFGSSYDTVLSVHTGCPGTFDNQVSCNDDAYGLQSALSFYAYSDYEYWIRLSGFDQAAGEYELHVGRGGEVTGTVTSAATGDPLADGEVRLWNSQGYYEGSATTDAEGLYAAGGLDAGSYFLTTRYFDGYFDELYDDVPCPGGSCDIFSGTPVDVLSFGSVAGVDFALEQGGIIAGTITDAVTALPIDGVRVEIYDASGYQVGDGYSDETGAYEVRGLTSGTYYAVAESSTYRGEIYDDLPCPEGAPYYCDPEDGEPIEVLQPGTAAGIDFALDRFGTIAGTVTEDGTANPIVSVWMAIYRSDGSYAGSDYTDSDGNYLFGGLEGGEYFVVAEGYYHSDELYDDVSCPGGYPYGCDLADGTPVAVDLNVGASGIDFVLQPLGALSGQVTDAATGDPIPSVTVEVYDLEGSYLGYDNTDADGNYLIDRLEAGSYVAYADDDEYTPELFDDIPCLGGLGNGCLIEDADPIDVQVATTTEGIDFDLDHLGEISGIVVAAATGEPLSYIYVNIWSMDGSFVTDTYTNSGGQFSAIGLSTGEYFATTDTYYDYVDEVYDNIACPPTGCDPTVGTPIAVVSGESTAGIDFALDRLGAITGVVTEAATGEPLDDAYLRLVDSTGAYVGSDYTYYNGSYSFSNLVPGTYFVVASHYDHQTEVYDDIPCPEGCDPTTGTPVEVLIDQTTEGIDFALEDRGAISVLVTDVATGEPISDIKVELWDSEGNSLYFYLWTNSEGVVVFGGLGPGTYYATTSNYHGYLDEVYDNVPCLGGAPQGCDPTKGTGIVVGSETTLEIEFALLYFDSGITGTVTDSVGDAIVDASVEVWDAAGTFIASAQTLITGEYFLQLEPGSYYVSTSNGQGYVDEVYPNVPCTEGPGSCDPHQGSLVAVAASGSQMIVTDIDFALEGGGSVIFFNGFESGDLSAW